MSSDNRSHGDIQFDSDIGSKATVEHHSIETTPEMSALREVLSDIGKDLQRIRVAPQEFEYMGSFSVHVYASNMKGNYAFVSVSEPGKCFFKLAEAAGQKLRGDIQNMFRGSMQKLRSGFSGA